jgi:stage IV sporulation protein B
MDFLKRAIPILLIILYCISPVAAAELIPGGQVVGLRLEDGSVYIAGFDPEIGSCAQQAGLKSGDRILTANGNPVTCPEDLRNALETSHGTVELSVLRGNKTKKLRLSPAVTADGPRLGVYLRQGISGLGTVTYYEPDGSFGALGHGVVNGASLIRFEKGTVCAVQLLSVRRGKAGQPGQLLGALQEAVSFGSADKNTAQGIFGKVSPPAQAPISTGQAHVGDAVIRTTVDGEGLREYSVQILKLYAGGDRCRNLLLKVTDPELLQKTGGIVQGMSGSPIIQDGKLIGAVTHVLVNDPTTGYGIFIENMLDAAA